MVFDSEVDPVFRVEVAIGQVIGFWVLDTRNVSQDEIKLESLVAVVPQFLRSPFGLEKPCVGFLACHDNRRFLHAPQDVRVFIKGGVHSQELI